MTLATQGIHVTMAEVGQMSARDIAHLLESAKDAERRARRRRSRR